MIATGLRLERILRNRASHCCLTVEAKQFRVGKLVPQVQAGQNMGRNPAQRNAGSIWRSGNIVLSQQSPRLAGDLLHSHLAADGDLRCDTLVVGGGITGALMSHALAPREISAMEAPLQELTEKRSLSIGWTPTLLKSGRIASLPNRDPCRSKRSPAEHRRYS